MSSGTYLRTTHDEGANFSVTQDSILVDKVKL